MKKWFAGLLTAFSLYSAIPVPRAAWNRDSIRYALCFFSLIGAVVAAAVWGWFCLCVRWGAAPGLFAAVAALLPVILTGGIHLDGLADTADALASHAQPEKKLEILRDPHIGAFGALYLAGYLLLSFGLWQQVYAAPRLLPLALAGFLLSRCANALSIATFPTARRSGLVYLFADSAHKRAVVACNAAVAGALLTLIVVCFPLWGAAAAGGCLVCFLLHRRLCLRRFGGNTGDLAGFLLQAIELLVLIVAAMGGMAACAF